MEILGVAARLKWTDTDYETVWSLCQCIAALTISENAVAGERTV